MISLGGTLEYNQMIANTSAAFGRGASLLKTKRGEGEKDGNVQ